MMDADMLASSAVSLFRPFALIGSYTTNRKFSAAADTAPAAASPLAPGPNGLHQQRAQEAAAAALGPPPAAARPVAFSPTVLLNADGGGGDVRQLGAAAGADSGGARFRAERPGGTAPARQPPTPAGVADAVAARIEVAAAVRRPKQGRGEGGGGGRGTEGAAACGRARRRVDLGLFLARAEGGPAAHARRPAAHARRGPAAHARRH